jgi:hypothetical protein
MVPRHSIGRHFFHKLRRFVLGARTTSITTLNIKCLFVKLSITGAFVTIIIKSLSVMDLFVTDIIINVQHNDAQHNGLFVTISINDTQHNNTQYNGHELIYIPQHNNIMPLR